MSRAAATEHGAPAGSTAPEAEFATGPTGAIVTPPAEPSAPVAPPPRAPDGPARRATGPASSPGPTGPRRRHRPPKAVLALLFLAVLGGAGWWWAATRQVTIPWPSAPVAGPLTASGTLEADEVLVGSEVAGRLVELVREGQAIRAGDVVARLDDALLQLQFRQADVVTQQQLAIQLDKYQLRSPISGTVIRVPVHTGEVISAGQTVVAVADLTSLDFTAYVLERHLGGVRVGQEVAVTADPFPGRTFRGVVTSTSQQAEFTPRNVQTQRDRLNLVFGVKIRVENPDGALKPGMPADAAFAPLD